MVYDCPCVHGGFGTRIRISTRQTLQASDQISMHSMHVLISLTLTSRIWNSFIQIFIFKNSGQRPSKNLNFDESSYFQSCFSVAILFIFVHLFISISINTNS